MALTSTTTFDIVGGTQTITFSDPAQIDEITFASNQVTFGVTAGFTISKSDLLLYLRFISVYNSLLFANFPSVGFASNQAWPASSFNITETSGRGGVQLVFAETSTSNNVLNIDYVANSQTGTVSARGTPVTISIQEFLMAVNMLNQYATQVNLN